LESNSNLKLGRDNETPFFDASQFPSPTCCDSGATAFAPPRQTKPDSATGRSDRGIPARITQAIDGNAARPPATATCIRSRDSNSTRESPPTPTHEEDDACLAAQSEQQAALTKLMDEQLSKDSTNFHKWLTPDQFGKQFGPADADIQTVTDWLTRQGFQEIKVGAGRTAIEFSGSVGQVRNAFHTEIHQLNVTGESRQANLSDPQIPAR